MTEYTEQDIIAGCLKHQSGWQEILHRKYYGTLLKICSRYAPTMEDAEQLLQDGFLRIFSKLGSYKNSGSFEGWMKRIVVNICLDYLRSKAGRMTMQVHKNTDDIENAQSTVAQDGLQQMAFKDLIRLIQELPDTTRLVFNLYVFEGYSHQQISKAIGITVNTSAWHIHHARKTLQVKIKSLHLQYEQYGGK